MLDGPMLMLETGLAAEMMGPAPDHDWESSLTPRLDIEWRTVTFAWVPHQLEEFETLLQSLPPSDLVGVADAANFPSFAEAAQKYGRLKEIRSVGIIIAHLVELAQAELDAAGESGDDADGKQ